MSTSQTTHVDDVSSQRVGTDLWYMIFEIIEKEALDIDVYSDDHGMHPVLQLLVVCKEWKQIAHVLLYRSLVFSNKRSLRLLVQLFKRGQLVHGRHPGDYVRHLVIGYYLQFDISEEDVMGLLAQTRELVSFEGPCPDLTVLGRKGARSLRKLTLFHMDEDNAVAALHALRDFAILEHLCFAVPAIFTPTQDLRSIPPLELPSLRCLELDVSMGAPGIFTHFSRSRFASLEELHFAAFFVGELSTMREFLQYHGPKLVHLGFSAADVILLPMSMFPQLRHLTFTPYLFHNEEPCPMLEWYSLLPPSIVHLHVKAFETSISYPDEKIAYFAELILFRRPSFPIKFIHLDQRMSYWRWLFRRHPSHAAVWTKLAIRLEEELGILLLDRDGRKWSLEP